MPGRRAGCITELLIPHLAGTVLPTGRCKPVFLPAGSVRCFQRASVGTAPLPLRYPPAGNRFFPGDSLCLLVHKRPRPSGLRGYPLPSPNSDPTTMRSACPGQAPFLYVAGIHSGYGGGARCFFFPTPYILVSLA